MGNDPRPVSREGRQGLVPGKGWAILGILALAFLAGGALYHRAESGRIRDQVYQTISGIGGQKARMAAQWRFERLGDARAAADDPAFTDLAMRFLRDTGAGALRKDMLASLESRVNAYRYSAALLLSPDGELRAAFPPGQADRHGIEGWSARSGEAWLSPLHPADGGIRLDAVAPLKDAAGRRVGYLVLIGDPRAQLTPLLRFWPSGGKSAEILIVESEGAEATWLVIRPEGGDSALAWRREPLEKAPELVRASLESQGRYPSEPGVAGPILADLRPVENSPWRIITRVDADEAMAEGRFRIRAVLVLAAAAFMLVTAILAMLLRHRQALWYRERFLAAERIRESEERLHLLVDHCPGAIAMFDMGMRYLVVSPRWLEDYHLGSASIIGRSHYEVFPDIPDRWKEIHRRCLAGAIEKCEEDPFPRADGGTEWVRWEIHPWRDGRGEIGGIVMFTEVVTPRILAQEALRKLNAELEQRVQERTAQLAAKNKELETFSYSVSHDLKAPLRGIDGYSKILLDEYQDKTDEEGQGFLRNIRSGADQMRQLIEDMLDYSKLERRSLSLVPVDLSYAVDRVLQERKFDLGEAQVTVEIAKGAVTADPEGLAMVLRNLVDNALKFSRQRKPPMVEIRSRVGDGRHVISIKDNGTGFSMKHHDLIFQIFQRLHRAEEYGGTGVGLAIVKKAVDRMEGRVWAESEPDRGATFNIELPCAPVKA